MRFGGKLVAKLIHLAHIAIEEPPGGGDAVFGVGELLLQGEEVCVGLQRGIRLGHGKQPLHADLQRRFVDGLVAGRAVVRHRLVAKLDDQLQHVTLVLRVAADRFDEIRNQLVSPLHFDFDIGPAFANVLADAHEAIEVRDQPQERQEHEQAPETMRISEAFHTAVLATLERRDEVLGPEVEELDGPVEAAGGTRRPTRCCCRR